MPQRPQDGHAGHGPEPMAARRGVIRAVEPAASRHSAWRTASPDGPPGGRSLGWRDMNLRWILIPVAILALFPGCQSREKIVVPPELVGVWRTAAAKYEDRYFEFRPGTLTLGIGGGSSETYPIRSIKRSQDALGTLYAVSYMNQAESVEEVFAFYYDPREGGMIRFKNQPEIAWTKEKP